MKQDREEAVQAITAMIDRSEKAQQKFVSGTAQHTLLKNRIEALKIALLLIESKELKKVPSSQEALKNAQAPITSLISKSEKSQQRLKQGTWQYTMLEKNLQALSLAALLLQQALKSSVE